MSPPDTTLNGFAYGEHLDGLVPRSLGYRLLAPAAAEPWSAEVEALARRLQAAPYPDHWPPTDLFCSVLLADGRRLVAVARYGLADHTPSHRRGGLELIGVIGPAGLAVSQALAVYRWLRQRRAETEDLHALGGRFALADVLAASPSAPPPADPVPVLPVRLWQEGVLLFAAVGPADPDHRLSLLEQGTGGNWQWLPLVGADFPLPTYAQRGPVVAWAPHLADVALKLDRKAAELAPPSRRRPVLPAALVALLLALLGANLWALLWLGSKLPAADHSPAPTAGKTGGEEPAPGSAPSGEDARDQFARALHAALRKSVGSSEWSPAQMLSQYERLARMDPNLRLRDSNTEGRSAVGMVGLLSQRSAKQVREIVKRALGNKGYSPNLVEAACEDVYQLLLSEAREGR
jgi:hypothetical protein